MQAWAAGAALHSALPFRYELVLLLRSRACRWLTHCSVQSVKLAVVHLLRSCELRLAPGQNELELTKDMLLAPAKGVHVSVHKR